MVAHPLQQILAVDIVKSLHRRQSSSSSAAIFFHINRPKTKPKDLKVIFKYSALQLSTAYATRIVWGLYWQIKVMSSFNLIPHLTPNISTVRSNV